MTPGRAGAGGQPAGFLANRHLIRIVLVDWMREKSQPGERDLRNKTRSHKKCLHIDAGSFVCTGGVSVSNYSAARRSNRSPDQIALQLATEAP